MTVTLPIASTWDGHPVDDPAVVQLSPSPSGAGLRLRLAAPLTGDPPPPGPPGPTDGLWEHEVVELFLVGPGDHYLEVEIGPWGHHLVLWLEGVRRPTRRLLPLELVTRRCGGAGWAAEAALAPALLPPRPWRVNAFRIHGPPGARRYLCHAALPGPHPDFHQPDRFPDWQDDPPGASPVQAALTAVGRDAPDGDWLPTLAAALARPRHSR